MKVAVDGSIYAHQRYGGITLILNEILPRMCDLDPDLVLDLWTWQRIKQEVPTHRQMTRYVIPDLHIPEFRPYRLWKSIHNWGLRRNHLTRNKLVNQSTADIWHATYYWQPAYWPGKMITHVHDLKEEKFPDIAKTPKHEHFRHQKAQSIHQADTVICGSEATRQDVMSYYNVAADKLRVVHHASSDSFRVLDSPKKIPGLPENQKVIVYVGMRGLFKNFTLLLKALKSQALIEDAALVVIGQEWTKMERAMLAEQGLQDQVYLLKHADDEQLSSVLNCADAFVYPSIYEGFGIPLLEAMACGCPIVASRIPSSVEVCGECALFFDPFSLDELIDALNQALREGRGSSRAKQSLKRVRQFSWQQAAESTLAIYHELV